jgi:energy-coupling factor transporter ATP-binding protein EcfA2
VIDLVEAGTVDPGQAAWLLDRIQEGCSWLVGARPGGAGKTTIMSALLGLLPADETVHVTDDRPEWRRAATGECVVAYEISPGGYEGYVWDRAVRDLVAAGRRGARIVSNLHADTLADARCQIVDQCGAPTGSLRRFHLFIPIQLSNGPRGYVRRVETLHLSDGESAWADLSPALCADQASVRSLAFIQSCLQDGTRHIEDVRGRLQARS